MNYVVHNVAHHPKTRLIRAQAAVHPRHKQFILKTQRRLIPNRPLTISEDEVVDNLEELHKLHSQGIVEIRTTDGRLVSLQDFNVESPKPLPPKPNFPDRTLHNAAPRGGSKAFVPDTTEPLPVQDGAHSGGGMTPEAVAAAAEDAKLPPLPEELKHLEDGEDEEQLEAAPTGEEPTGEDEAEVEHKETSKAKKSSRRR